jgi:hypothetical protein
MKLRLLPAIFAVLMLIPSAMMASYSSAELVFGDDNFKISVENQLKNRNLFFPNPVRDIINIENQDLLIEKVEVYNIIGSLVASMDISETKEPKIDVNHLERGNYIIRFYSIEKHIISKKVSLN